MNMHKNARTTPHSRVLMIKRVREDGWPVKTTAVAAGVSVRTVYKWLARYRNEGLSGLVDRSSTPRRRPHALSSVRIELIRSLREARHVAHSIARQLHLARSTVSTVLSRLGWGRLAQLTPPVPVVRYERRTPGELVHLDVKKLGRFFVPATGSPENVNREGLDGSMCMSRSMTIRVWLTPKCFPMRDATRPRAS